MIDLTDWNIAEYIFLFVMREEEWKKYCEKRDQDGPLSMLEYVTKYARNDFEEWFLSDNN